MLPAIVVTVLPSPRRIETVLPASALPVNTLPSALKVPVGAVGAVRSTITLVAEETGLVPELFVAVAVKAWEPSLNAGVVKVQLPELSATAVPIDTPLLYSVTVVPGRAVPLRVGVVSSVVLPLVRLPVTVPTLSLMVVISGAFGTGVAGAITDVLTPALPALSVA